MGVPKNVFNNLIIRETPSSIMIDGHKFILLLSYAKAIGNNGVLLVFCITVP